MSFFICAYQKIIKNNKYSYLCTNFQKIFKVILHLCSMCVKRSIIKADIIYIFK